MRVLVQTTHVRKYFKKEQVLASEMEKEQMRDLLYPSDSESDMNHI